jgi:hypothetical protein
MIMDFLEINENTLALAKRCNVINENYVIWMILSSGVL